ncbi:Septin spn4 [Elsinoe australis]|uniref:Septin spn4 n=1 Tax=Elsinoe australis TaxID=40998 RepID=A0A2P7YLE6_9PEZI|nr:Septin spn4 [Elsinoe australis]
MSVSARKTQMEENLAKSSAARSGSPEGQSENGIGGVQGSSFPLLGRSNARAKLHSKSASFDQIYRKIHEAQDLAMADIASPIGIANLPNQRHKIVAKRGAAFTIMVAGESGLGKTTFINTLFSTTIKNYADHRRRHAKQIDKTVEIEITKAELEEKFFKVRLTVIDTPGFGDYVNNRDSWQPIIEFLDDQHESYMLQEQQPRRTDRIDLRVHTCLYFIRPTGHTLKPLDIEVMKRLCTRVNLIPVIAKADTLSPADLQRFKSRVRTTIEAQGIKVYQPPLDDDDEGMLKVTRDLITAMPFAVIGSEKDVTTPDGRSVKGRQYAWGVAEVENEEHCDFRKLRSVLIRNHMLDLIHTTEENHYEAYRAQQMETRKFGEARPRKLDNPKFKEEEEALRKRFTEQVKVEEQRFRAWEQKLINERDRLNKDLETSHQQIKQLENELENLQGSMGTGRSHGRR